MSVSEIEFRCLLSSLALHHIQLLFTICQIHPVILLLNITVLYIFRVIPPLPADIMNIAVKRMPLLLDHVKNLNKKMDRVANSIRRQKRSVDDNWIIGVKF